MTSTTRLPFTPERLAPAGGLTVAVGTVTQVSPVHVQVDGRDFGPLRATRAGATGISVGDQALLIADSHGQLIVVDKMS